MQMGGELSKHNSTKKTSVGERRSLNHRESHEGFRSGLNIPRRQSGEGGTGERREARGEIRQLYYNGNVWAWAGTQALKRAHLCWWGGAVLANTWIYVYGQHRPGHRGLAGIVGKAVIISTDRKLTRNNSTEATIQNSVKYH